MNVMLPDLMYRLNNRVIHLIIDNVNNFIFNGTAGFGVLSLRLPGFEIVFFHENTKNTLNSLFPTV